MSSRAPNLNHLVKKLYGVYVTETDRALLNCIFAKVPTQLMLDESMKVCDIERIGSGKTILLSYLMHEHPELHFSDYNAPRIRGLIRYFRFANMKILSHFSKIGRAYNKAGIPMLLFKGGGNEGAPPGTVTRHGGC